MPGGRRNAVAAQLLRASIIPSCVSCVCCSPSFRFFERLRLAAPKIWRFDGTLPAPEEWADLMFCLNAGFIMYFSVFISTMWIGLQTQGLLFCRKDLVFACEL
jgi:hypothetical protein